MKSHKSFSIGSILKSLACIIIVAVIAAVVRFMFIDKPDSVTVISSSALSEVINISELSTAEFKYRGIAEIYEDDDPSEILCRVCYSSVIKAGVDMQQVQLYVDTENKSVILILPDIELKVTIVDEQSMAILPSDAKVGIADMLKAGKEDAENEARSSAELMEVARENLKATIEGILYPIIKPQDYSIIWG